MRELLDHAVQEAAKAISFENWAAAKSICKHVLNLESDNADAMSLLGIAAKHDGNWELAEHYLQSAADLNPTCVNLNTLGVLFMGRDDKRAKEIFLQAHTTDPNSSMPLSNLSQIEKMQENWAAAESYIERACELEPQCGQLVYLRGDILAQQLKTSEAIEAYRHALTLTDNPETHWNLACSLLLDGQWAEGWKEFECRWAMFPHHAARHRQLVKLAPEWKGEDINGKRLFLHCEQGIGDKLQYVRFAKDLKAKGATVILSVAPDLAGLLGTVEGIDETHSVLDSLPSFDYHVSLMSLTHLLGIETHNVPNKPYISSPKGGNFFAGMEGQTLKVGICWGGSAIHRNDSTRSCPLKYFAPLAELPNVQLFGLQKETRPRFTPGIGIVDLTAGVTFPLVNLAEHLTDWEATAYIINSLDLVVTVDTSVAHLAGAMGKPVYLLISYVPDWRWLLDRETTPWYPSMTLWRQDKSRTYEPVLKKIAERIAAMPAR